MDSGINNFTSKPKCSQEAADPSSGPSVQRKRRSLVPSPATQTPQMPVTSNADASISARRPSEPASRSASLKLDPTLSVRPSRMPSLALETAPATAPATAIAMRTDPAGHEGQSPPSSRSTSSSKISPTDTRGLPQRHKRTLLIGISGAPASSKTSLALLLSLLLPSSRPVFVIHQDDYRIPKILRVPSENDEQHDNSRNAVDFATFKKLLQYAKREGQLPNFFKTVHDEPAERERAETLIGEKDWKYLKQFMAKTIRLSPGFAVGIVEGPLLFHDPEIRDLLDVRLFIWASMEISRTRWLDAIACGNYKVEGVPSWLTSDHFDRIMWRNYIEENRHLFHRGDVAGVAHIRVCDELGIRVQPKIDGTLNETMRWAVDMVVNDIDNLAHTSRRARSQRRRSSVDDPVEGWRGWPERLRRVLYKLV